VSANLKMATGRNFSMSGINSGHHYLPTYQILMISDNVEFLRYCVLKQLHYYIFSGRNLKSAFIYFKMAAKIRYKKCAVKIQHCPISSKFDKSSYNVTLFMCQSRSTIFPRILIFVIIRPRDMQEYIFMSSKLDLLP
jgi:hypothetical protein